VRALHRNVKIAAHLPLSLKRSIEPWTILSRVVNFMRVCHGLCQWAPACAMEVAAEAEAEATLVTARMAAAIPGATSTLPDLTQAQICRTSTLPRDIKAVRMTPTR